MSNFQGVTQHPLLQLSGISACSKSIESEKQFSNRRTSSCNAYRNYKWYINKPVALLRKGWYIQSIGTSFFRILGVNVKHVGCFTQSSYWAVEWGQLFSNMFQLCTNTSLKVFGYPVWQPLFSIAFFCIKSWALEESQKNQMRLADVLK